MATAIAGRTMELEGNLRAFQLPDILRFLAMGNLSGVLTLANAERQVGLMIREGRLVGSTSPDRMLRIGQILVCTAAIRRRDLEEVLECQHDRPSANLLGEVLIQRALASPEQVRSALELQIREELWDLLSWGEGTFKFEHSLPATAAQEMLALEIEPLLEEGSQRMEQWREIDGALSDRSVIFRVRADLAAFPEARLQPGPWRVLSLINGRRSLQALMHLSGLGKFETLSAVDNLLTTQLIEPVERATLPAAPEDTLARAATDAGDQEPEASPARGLFGRRRRAASPVPAAAELFALNFITCAGFGCAVLNRLADRLGESASQPLLSERLWGEEGLRFARADLIEINDGHFDAAPLESYCSHAGGNTAHLAGCFEDSMAALSAGGRALVARAEELHGVRAERIVGEIVNPMADEARIALPADFMPRSWIRQWVQRPGRPARDA